MFKKLICFLAAKIIVSKYSRIDKIDLIYLPKNVYVIFAEITDTLDYESHLRTYIIIPKSFKIFRIGKKVPIEMLRQAVISWGIEIVKYYSIMNGILDGPWCKESYKVLKIKLPEYCLYENVISLPKDAEVEKNTFVYGYY